MNIAIIDDKEDIRYAIEKILTKEGHNCYEFDGSEEDLIDGLEVFDVELIILDMMLKNNLTALDIIRMLKDKNINIPIVIITAHTTPTNMIKVSQFGVIDIIEKPFGKNDIIDIVNRYNIANSQSSKEYKIDNDFEFIGSFATMQSVFKDIGFASKNRNNVLIVGETGTGKDLIARIIHNNTYQADAPFVAINCASLPENLFEKLMFGRSENFSKNISQAHEGYVQKANGGTLYLDNIDELNFSLQSKLLRFLETKSYYTLGDSNENKFCGKIICSSSKSKEYLKDPTNFRSDLYFRISACEIVVPSLKERKEDIVELSYFFIKKYCHELGVSQKYIDDDALEFLKNYNFKGNIRELKNRIYNIVLNSRNQKISIRDIEANFKQKEENKKPEFMHMICQKILDEYGIDKAKEIHMDFEREMLTIMVAQCKNYTKLASILGISRNTFKAKCKKYNIKIS